MAAFSRQVVPMFQRISMPKAFLFMALAFSLALLTLIPVGYQAHDLFTGAYMIPTRDPSCMQIKAS